MTIIQPNKTSYKANFWVLILTLTSVSATVWIIFLYNQLVDFRHEVRTQETNLSQAEVMNAEFKNNLYTIIDAKNLESSNNNESLILDKNPEYVKTINDNQLTINN